MISHAVGRLAFRKPLECMLRPAASKFVVHLLYLDDSGSVSNPQDRYIVLAGVAVFERQPHHFSERLDAIAKQLRPEDPAELEFHATEILGGKKKWRKIRKDSRYKAYRDGLSIIGSSKNVRVFGAAIHKASVSPDDPMEFAFEQMCNRFDRFLGRLHQANNTQRGLIVLDKSSYETSLQTLARDFRLIGHRWGQLRNMCDVPLFVDSKATRMIQYADMVAYAIRQYFEFGNDTYFHIFSSRIDSEEGKIHGLVHHTDHLQCQCFACRQRRC